MREAVIMLIITVVLWATVFMCLGKPAPRVFWSYTEDRCVKVLVVEDGHEVCRPCSTMDKSEKYERIWVK
jgi:hypothetical protein